MLFIKGNIPFRLLKPGNFPFNTEALFIEINLLKKKMLMCCGTVLHSFTGNYDNFLIVGDLNSEITESSMHGFCNSYN